jgi:hypothetical protein
MLGFLPLHFHTHVSVFESKDMLQSHFQLISLVVPKPLAHTLGHEPKAMIVTLIIAMGKGF